MIYKAPKSQKELGRKVTEPNLTGLVSPNAGEIAVESVTHRF